MKEIKCIKCGEVLCHEDNRHIVKLQDHADRDCNKQIYLMCSSGHMEKYFYKLETKIEHDISR